MANKTSEEQQGDPKGFFGWLRFEFAVSTMLSGAITLLATIIGALSKGPFRLTVFMALTSIGLSLLGIGICEILCRPKLHGAAYTGWRKEEIRMAQAFGFAFLVVGLVTLGGMAVYHWDAMILQIGQ